MGISGARHPASLGSGLGYRLPQPPPDPPALTVEAIRRAQAILERNENMPNMTHAYIAEEYARRLDQMIAQRMSEMSDRHMRMRDDMAIYGMGIDPASMREFAAPNPFARPRRRKPALPDICGKFKRLTKKPIVKEMMPAFAQLTVKQRESRVKKVMELMTGDKA